MKARWKVLITVFTLTIIAVAIVFALGGLESSTQVAYEPPASGETGDIEVVDEVKEVKITILEAFFTYDSITRQIWLILETEIQNKGEAEITFNFAPTSRFYVQDANGESYSTVNAYEGSWQGRVRVNTTSLFPGTAKLLTLQFHYVPEDAQDLKLVCQVSVEPPKQMSVAFEPQKIADEEVGTKPGSGPELGSGPEPEPAEKNTPAIEPDPASDSPAEVAARFIWLLLEERYQEAKELIAPEAMQIFEGKLDELFEEQEVRSFKVAGETKVEGRRAYVPVLFTFTSGEPRKKEVSVELILIEGNWKITD